MRADKLQAVFSREEKDVAYYPADPEEAAKVEPVIAEIPVLTLSWELLKEETDLGLPMQWAYRAAVYKNGVCIWESGKTETGEQTVSICPAPDGGPEDFLFATVTLWDEYQMITDTVSLDLVLPEEASQE